MINKLKLQIMQCDDWGFLFMSFVLINGHPNFFSELTPKCILKSHVGYFIYRCGYDQLPGASSHPIDGVLGLGRGRSSIVSQLHKQGLVSNVVGHCLSGRGGGFLFFGDDLYDNSQVVWTPMSRDNT